MIINRNSLTKAVIVLLCFVMSNIKVRAVDLPTTYGKEFNVCFDFPPDNNVFEGSRDISDDEFSSKINVATQSNTLDIVSSLDGNVKLEMALFDLNGVSVLKDKCVLYPNEKKQIALDDLNNGAYFLQIKSQDKIISKVFYLYK